MKILQLRMELKRRTKPFTGTLPELMQRLALAVASEDAPLLLHAPAKTGAEMPVEVASKASVEVDPSAVEINGTIISNVSFRVFFVPDTIIRAKCKLKHENILMCPRHLRNNSIIALFPAVFL